MQVTRNRLIATGLLLTASIGTLADPLHTDAAWKQGTLANGLHWQILATPQRPTDHIEIHFSIRTGSLNENSQQTGYSHFLPRLALSQREPVMGEYVTNAPMSNAPIIAESVTRKPVSGEPAAREQARNLWQQSLNAQNPLPLAITSYNFTAFNLSLPNNQDNAIKSALNWLANVAGHMTINQQTIAQALQAGGQAAQAIDQASQTGDQASQTADQASQADDQTPQPIDQASQADDQTPQPIDQAPQTGDQAPQAIDQASQADEQAPQAIDQVLQIVDQTPQTDRVASWPASPQDGWWRYRLQGSNLTAHDPDAPLQRPVNASALNQFYTTWYTPDNMTLIIVGNVDSRALSEQIINTFSSLQGKQTTPAPLPTLLPLPATVTRITTSKVADNRLALIWDSRWLPIRDSAALFAYWQESLARDAILQYVQHKLNKSAMFKTTRLTFDCQILFQRQQCAMTIDPAGNKPESRLEQVTRRLAELRDNGLTDREISSLIAEKRTELQGLFATYAHTDTQTLLKQRIRSLRSQMIDIAPEQYQKLRQQFLDGLTSAQLNQSVHQQLTHNASLILFQPQGEEAAYNMRQLLAIWQKNLYPADTQNILPPAQKPANASAAPVIAPPASTPIKPPSAAAPAKPVLSFLPINAASADAG